MLFFHVCLARQLRDDAIRCDSSFLVVGLLLMSATHVAVNERLAVLEDHVGMQVPALLRHRAS